MSTASLVPETRNLSADDAWSALRRVGRGRLIADAFVRLRVSDGFSHARSLAFMTSLAAVQGIIAVVALAALFGGTGFNEMVVATIRRTVPKPAGDMLTAAAVQANANGSEHRYAAVAFGLVGCLVATTTALGQIERALNRLYGIEQDRASLQKYGLAFLLALTSGVLTSLAFVSLAVGRDLFRTWGVGSLSTVWNVARWPLGLVLITLAVTLLLRTCPRRRQPESSWLAFGAGIAVVLWALVTGGFGLFFHLSQSFGQTYGPLAGLVALMLWALLSSISILYGAAVAAQLEAARQGVPAPQDAEKRAESEPDEGRTVHAAAASASASGSASAR